jgi:hypothetical protein
MKTIIKKTVRTERLTKRKSSTVFFVTDAGNLLRWRSDIDIWRIFNPINRNWEKPPFDIGEVFSTLPVSKKEAGEVIKHQLKLTHQHQHDDTK